MVFYYVILISILKNCPFIYQRLPIISLIMHFLKVVLFFICLGGALAHAQEQNQERQFPDPSKEYTQQQFDSIFAIAVSYHNRGDYETVIEKLPAFIDNAKKAKASVALNNFRSLLGNSFIYLDEISSADLIFNQVLEDATAKNDTTQIIYSYINLGNVYLNRDVDRAISYLDKTFEYKTSDNEDDLGYAIVYNNLAELYVNKELPGKAQQYLDLVTAKLDSAKITSRRVEFEFSVHHLQGSVYLLQQLHFRSIESSIKALEVYKTVEGEGLIDQKYVFATYENLIKAYEITRQYEMVNETRKIYNTLRDANFEREKLRQQERAKMQYNVARYQQEARESQFQTELANQKVIQERKIFWIFLGVGFLLLVLIGTLLYTRRKRNILLKNLKIKNAQYLEAKEVSEKLARKNTKFLSTISHELRTPLYGIIGLSSVFLNDQKLKEYSEEFNSLKFSADYLLSLVNDILNMNKYESQKGQELKEEHFNISILIKSIVQTFQFLNEKNNNEVNLKMDLDIPEVLYGDKTKISQVVMNLLSNASKFTQDGSINLEINPISNNGKVVELSFTIADTGRGIKEEYQKEIFEEFTQVPSSITEGGTGLGLPIVNKLLRILNSQLEMESTYGIGTTFSFLLPLKIGSKQELDSNIDGKDIKKLDHKKLLIVDDNKINQLVTQKVLEQYNMEHDTVNNGQEAVDIVQKNQYDYILMDINMPVMNGIDATIAIRDLGITTPVIALTAADDLNLEQDVFSHGIDAILVKPYHTEQFLNVLIEHLH